MTLNRLALACAIIATSACTTSASAPVANLADAARDAHMSEPLFNALYRERYGVWIAEPKVVGGALVSAGEDPWQVAIVSAAEADKVRILICGGTLIAPSWIVTAAHCVDNHTSPRKIDVIMQANDLDGTGSRRKVNDIVVHRDWTKVSPNGARYLNDIALVELKRPADDIRTLALPPSERLAPLRQDTPVRVTGYGERYPVPQGRPLKYVPLHVVSNTLCNRTLAYQGQIKDTMVCAWFPDIPLSDQCHGDSGGPLSTPISGAPALVGIVSFARDPCGSAPGVYTRVQSYLGWIEGCMKGDVRCIRQ